MKNNINLFYHCVPTKGILIRRNKFEHSPIYTSVNINVEHIINFPLVLSFIFYQGNNSSPGL